MQIAQMVKEWKLGLEMHLVTLILLLSNVNVWYRWNKKKIHPGEAMDKDLYDLPESKLKGIPTVSASLRESLNSLDKDREFLKAGDVFTDNLIDAYISLKMDEVLQFEHTPHPVEFKCIIQSNLIEYIFWKIFKQSMFRIPD